MNRKLVRVQTLRATPSRMIYVVWQFQVSPYNRIEFEKAYRNDGVWAQLFRKDPAYVRTTLVREAEHAGSYLTIDIWKDRESYLEFKHRFAAEYSKIDSQCEALTESERLIGFFEEAG